MKLPILKPNDPLLIKAMKNTCTILSILFAFESHAQFEKVGPVRNDIINTVVEISNGPNTGSGFLVFVGQNRFLITNKHLVGNWSPVDSLIYSDSIYFYPYSEIGFLRIGVKISDKGKPITSKVKVHPNHKIDIAAIDITSDISGRTINRTAFIDTTYLMTLKGCKTLLTYGSQVFTIGYPAGIKTFKTNQPIVKSGYIASKMDGDIVFKQIWKNKKGREVETLTDGKIFIVDGLIIPGNSGGPVILSREVTWFEIDSQLKHLVNTENKFIGIVSNIYINAGLAVIFSSDNILEVIRQFK